MSSQRRGKPPAGPQLPKAVDDCHRLLEWMLPHIEKFPRVSRFTLGERLERALLDVLEALLTATYTRDKADPLAQANVRLAVAKHLWRLSHSRQFLATRSYAHGAERMEQLGRQIGGWRSAHAQRASE
jgi:hypothetical protein